MAPHAGAPPPRLLRTAQEEKRTYLCNALLNSATGTCEEDEITVLLPLVEALSLRHFVVLDDLLAHCDPPVSYLRPEDLKLWTVWARIGGRFPGGDDGKYMYQSIVADLEGRGLIKRSFGAYDLQEDRPLYPSLQAKKLLRFVRSPVPDTSES